MVTQYQRRFYDPGLVETLCGALVKEEDRLMHEATCDTCFRIISELSNRSKQTWVRKGHYERDVLSNDDPAVA